MTDDLGARLSCVDEVTAPAAERFDSGPALAGELVVLPSAFNPPTVAHQHLLERALGLAVDARPVAMLTTRNVDKGLHGASLEQRVEMLLALQTAWPELAVLVSNQARIIDQAEALRRAFGDALRLRFVVGFDTLERLFARRYYSDMEAELAPFFERSRVLAANRAGIGVDAVREWIAENAGPFSRAIDVMEIDEEPASMSSTAARERVLAGDGEMLPAVVRRYIERHGLYR
ncbi:MAG: hypothetical protein AB7J35_18170 [Dehalococcoidia bacterium]